MKCLRFVAVLALLLTFVTAGFCEDWPQFRGVNRDGRSPEKGLLKVWPQEGPKLLWANEELGFGYASPSIVEGTVFTSGSEGSQGFVYAIAPSGKLKWKKEYGPEWTNQHPGARTTPTFDEGKLYIMSGMGKLVCLDAATGDEKWSLDAVAQYKGKIPSWGVAESPLVVGDKVICTPGGSEASVIAVDKNSGKVLWTTKDLSEMSAYCSPILVPTSGSPILVTMLAYCVVGIVPETGEVLWRQEHKTRYDIHAVSPVFDEGYLYITSGYGAGGEMFKLSSDGRQATRLWTDKNLDCHHGGVVSVGGCIYGSNYGGTLVCLAEKDGRVMFQDKGVGKGSVICADGMLYCYSERGTLGLVKAAPEKYELAGSFNITKGDREHWAHPAISDGKLYIRHGAVLMVYDIKQK